MFQKSELGRDGDRAEWRHLLRCGAVVCLAALLSGCSGSGDPAAPTAETEYTTGLSSANQAIVAMVLEREPEVARLLIFEQTIGRWLMGGDSTYDHVYILPGQPLQFTWLSVGGVPLDIVETYRHGWDLTDPDDPSDPGWSVPPGHADQNYETDEMVFWSGMHELTIERRDGEQLLVRAVIAVSAEPVLGRFIEPTSGNAAP